MPHARTLFAGQSVVGPVLIVPYRYRYRTRKTVEIDGKLRQRDVTETATANAYFLPDELNIDGDVRPKKLHRGIFEAVVHLIREHLHFDAVAVRLRQGDDFPFLVSDGFPEGFSCRDQELCSKEDGVVVCDLEGQAKLSCLCGAVIRGQITSLGQAVSQGGSFWTTDLEASLRALPPAADPNAYRLESLLVKPVFIRTTNINIMITGAARPISEAICR